MFPNLIIYDPTMDQEKYVLAEAHVNASSPLMKKSAATGPSYSLLKTPLHFKPSKTHHQSIYQTLPDMESISQPQNHNLKPKAKRHKKRLNLDQLRLLESNFNYEKKLEPELKAQLARDLGLPPRQVAIWYQNKRARWKAQSLELDHRALQLRLDSVFTDRRRLEKEVGMLRAELQRAHEMLFVMNLTAAAAAPISSGGTMSGTEDGTASYPEVANCNWANSVEVLQAEELYACLMSENDQSASQNVRNDIFALPGS